jgi:antibiotic biosynthesis monooxygenase (ABM) superfamily enzyme
MGICQKCLFGLIMELSTFSIILALVLTLVLSFILIPALFNNIAKLWYYRKNSGVNGFRHESMFYNAKEDTIEADQSPIH